MRHHPSPAPNSHKILTIKTIKNKHSLAEGDDNLLNFKKLSNSPKMIVPCLSVTLSLMALLVLLPSATHSFRTQSAGVRGVLMCGDQPLADTKVKLYDHDRGPDVDDLMATTTTDLRGRFQLSGKTSELTTIDVQLKIFHDCDDGIMPCQRKVVFNIPDSYVSTGATPAKFFDIGTVNMQIIFEKEERSCIN